MIFTSAKLIALVFLITAGIYVSMNYDWYAQNFSNIWDAKQLIKTGETWTTESLGGMALVLALGTAIIGSLFSSDAWNNVTFIAGEIRNPQKIFR